jgi:hypothetical protein
LLFDDVHVLDVNTSNQMHASIHRVGVGVVVKLVFAVFTSNVRVFAVLKECRQIQRARLDASVCCDVSNHCSSCLKKPAHVEVDDCLGSDGNRASNVNNIDSMMGTCQQSTLKRHPFKSDKDGRKMPMRSNKVHNTSSITTTAPRLPLHGMPTSKLVDLRHDRHLPIFRHTLSFPRRDSHIRKT